VQRSEAVELTVNMLIMCSVCVMVMLKYVTACILLLSMHCLNEIKIAAA